MFFFFFLVVGSLQEAGLVVATEYKVCATIDKAGFCKLIEASRKEVTCVTVVDSVDCLLKMQNKMADFGVFTPEESFLVEHFLGDNAVVLAEIRHQDRDDNPFGFETVAVVKSNFSGGLSALKKLSYCHPGFSKAQYWSDRVLKSFEEKILDHFQDDIKCNSAKRSAYEDDLYRLSEIFDKACRPGTWAVNDWWDKKLKREYHSLCEQCEHPATCSYKVMNKGRHSDALRCLTLRGGNVTYTALEYVREYFELDSEHNFLTLDYKKPEHYNFLCPDGSTRPLTSSDSCSWIKQPWTSVIALSSTQPVLLGDLKAWLNTDNVKRGTWADHLKNILVKSDRILHFREKSVPISTYINEGRSIPKFNIDTCRPPIKWCTTCEYEKKKCEYLSTAALIHGLPTKLECVSGASKKNCLKKISSKKADLVYVDTELGYIARKVYNLTASAYLETERTGNYYGVAVVKGNSIKKFKSLQGKRACFPQYNGLGWITYVEALKFHSIIPSRTCSNSKKVWKYFSKACAPGALDSEWTSVWGKVPEHLCTSCGNSKEHSCDATTANPYYGEIGALKCLNNKDGDVAFLDFYTIKKHLATSKGAEDINMEDFNILCRDGSVQNFNLTNPDQCSYTQLNGGEVVTRNNLEEVFKTDVFHTLMELDDLFGTTSRHYDPVLKMFESFDGKSNLLFKESAVSLVGVYETQNSFVNNYKSLLNNLENCLGGSGSAVMVPSLFAVLFSIFFIFYNR